MVWPSGGSLLWWLVICAAFRPVTRCVSLFRRGLVLWCWIIFCVVHSGATASGQLRRRRSVVRWTSAAVRMSPVGQLCGQLCLGFLLQTVIAGRALNDDRWHILHIKRRGHSVELAVDNAFKAKGRWCIIIISNDFCSDVSTETSKRLESVRSLSPLDSLDRWGKACQGFVYLRSDSFIYSL